MSLVVPTSIIAELCRPGPLFLETVLKQANTVNFQAFINNAST